MLRPDSVKRRCVDILSVIVYNYVDVLTFGVKVICIFLH